MATSGLPTLIVGVGGTGLRVLQRVKERLLETYYGEVPSHITLLELDTALQSPADNFCGVQLNEQAMQTGMGSGYIVQEMELIQTTPTYTMDNVFAEAERDDPRWSWMEVNKLKDLLPPAGRQILEGAGAYRPVGRTAFFLNYGRVQQRLNQVMQQVTQQQLAMEAQFLQADGGLQSDVNLAAAKRNVFLVGSLAGGTGSGAFLDVAAMMRAMRQSNPAFTNIVLIGIIALPRFFTDIADNIGRRVPNTYAGLREIDRFTRGHTSATPYHMVGGNGQPLDVANTLFDLCYLVDVKDYYGTQLAQKVDHGPIAVMADMITAHTDLRLGLRLNAANINVGANYHDPRTQTQESQYRYQSRRYYSAMNSHTVIFPREDVAKALSLRFLLDLIDTQIIQHVPRSSPPTLVVPTSPMPVDEVVTFLSKDNPTSEEKTMAELSTQQSDIDLGVFIRTVLRESANPNKKYPTALDKVLGWLIEDGQLRQQVQKVMQDSLAETNRTVDDRRDMNQYVQRVDTWLRRYLGSLNDPNIPLGDRSGGAWEQALGNLVTQARPTMMARIDELVLRILNQRQAEDISDSSKISLLRANRLGYALALLRELKERVRTFEKQTETSFGKINVIQARKNLQETRGAVTSFKGGWGKHNPGPDYLTALRELAEAESQRLLRNLILQMAQQFGGDIAEMGRERSVLDVAIKELEEWAAALTRVREQIAFERERHEARRKQKYAIVSRSYVTDPQRFNNATQIEDGLYARYKPLVWRTLLGPDPSGGSGAGLFWQPRPGTEVYFDYAIMTKEKNFSLNPNYPTQTESHAMLGMGSGVEGINRAWQTGAFRLFAEQIRGDQEARVAAYIMQLNPNQIGFVNRLVEPNSRALVALNTSIGIQPNPQQEEHYLAVDSTSDDRKVTDFYSWFTNNWQQISKQYLQSESDVACTFLTLYHGLELEHVQGFVECEPDYRRINTTAGCQHLFREEQLAADYESRIPLLNISTWKRVNLLHPEVVVCLNDTQRVRDFAFALVSGLITQQIAGQEREFFLALPDSKSLRLSDANKIDPYRRMGEIDRQAARLLQAFQTFMLRGHAVGYEFAEDDPIMYEAVQPAFNRWFESEYPNVSKKELDELLDTWKSRPASEGPGLSVLFNGESKDPRFRDLGIVLYLELNEWCKARA
jgi:hypothetical protein